MDLGMSLDLENILDLDGKIDHSGMVMVVAWPWDTTKDSGYSSKPGLLCEL